MSRAFDRIDGRCVMCGKTREQVRKLILGVHGGICLDCVELCDDIRRTETAAPPPAPSETLQQITVKVERTGGKRLAGKVAIVTGASRGIGAAIARRLGAEGAAVVVNYHQSAEAAEKVVADILALGSEAIALQADLIDSDQIRAMFAQVQERCRRLDILVNNAGVAEYRPLEAIDQTHFGRQFKVNVSGLLFATQEAARAFGTSGGRIINISSGAAQAAPPGASVYSATKAAVDTLTRCYAAELGPRRITVNAVAPGLTETDMLAAVIPAEVQKAMIATTALRRLGTPEDTADVVAFLASDDARWITGQVIGVNGGLR